MPVGPCVAVRGGGTSPCAWIIKADVVAQVGVEPVNSLMRTQFRRAQQSQGR